ncbi:MAG TPA: hypothetical protein VKE69_05845, partial [Planctomycetota bacterium]|nr:hypothetical protein [Planctomycetota bacterium]
VPGGADFDADVPPVELVDAAAGIDRVHATASVIVRIASAPTDTTLTTVHVYAFEPDVTGPALAVKRIDGAASGGAATIDPAGSFPVEIAFTISGVTAGPRAVRAYLLAPAASPAATSKRSDARRVLLRPGAQALVDPLVVQP